MRFGMLLICLLLLVGCLPPSQNQLRMEKDLAEMKRRLAQLEVQQIETENTEVASGGSLQRQVAEVVAGLDTLRVDFQSINGRLDDLGRNNQQLEDDIRLTKEDLGLQLAAMNSRIDQQEQVISKLTEDIKTAPVGQQPAANTPPVAAAETGEQLYQRALDMIRKENNFAEGHKLLEEFANKYPKHDLYVNALYWGGESLYGEQKYEQAILRFQDVISKHPEHPKASAAMLKQALAFNALGDTQNARTTMQKLIEQYPDSAQVESAKKFLAQ